MSIDPFPTNDDSNNNCPNTCNNDMPRDPILCYIDIDDVPSYLLAYIEDKDDLDVIYFIPKKGYTKELLWVLETHYSSPKRIELLNGLLYLFYHS